MDATTMTGPPAGLPADPILLEPVRRRRGIAWFLAITFGVSWTGWLLAYALGGSLSSPVVQLVTAAFVPAGAAVVVRRWITGEGFADAGLRPRVRAAWRHYVAAALPLVVLGCALAAAFVTGLARGAAWDRLDPWTLLAAPGLVVLAAPLFWGEEFGWTSYLRMRLLPGRPVAATLLTGVIWGVWHWPLPFVGYFGTADLGGPLGMVVQLALWVVLSMLLELVLSWSFWRSGSIWTTSMVHAGNNLVVSAGLYAVLEEGAGVSINVSTALLCLGLLPVCGWIVRPGFRRPAAAE
ncbi:MAG: CPBP family intramembrane glutamic endopeptidase [Phycicoccus sp.]